MSDLSALIERMKYYEELLATLPPAAFTPEQERMLAHWDEPETQAKTAS